MFSPCFSCRVLPVFSPCYHCVLAVFLFVVSPCIGSAVGGSTDETTNENTNGTRSELSHGVHEQTAVLGSPVRRAPTNQRGLTASHLAKVGPVYFFSCSRLGLHSSACAPDLGPSSAGPTGPIFSLAPPTPPSCWRPGSPPSPRLLVIQTLLGLHVFFCSRLGPHVCMY